MPLLHKETKIELLEIIAKGIDARAALYCTLPGQVSTAHVADELNNIAKYVRILKEWDLIQENKKASQ